MGPNGAKCIAEALKKNDFLLQLHLEVDFMPIFSHAITNESYRITHLEKEL